MRDKASPQTALIGVLTHLLKPLVRLLIHYQITFPYISNLLKSIYVEVAEESFPVGNKRPTDSRLSLLTGVHRKDVRRLRAESLSNNDNDVVADPGSLGAQVVSAWLSLPEYSSKHGEALALHRLAAAGEPSFESLVEKISRQDLRSRSLLDEWLRMKMVNIDAQDKVHLVQDAFLPDENFDAKAYFFGQHLHDHFSASASNLMGNMPPYFDRSVYFNNLSAESITALKTYIDKKGMQLIKEINLHAREMQKKDSDSKLAKYRFRFGAYYFAEEQKNAKGIKDEQ